MNRPGAHQSHECHRRVRVGDYRIFCHIKAFEERSKRPSLNATVTFELARVVGLEACAGDRRGFGVHDHRHGPGGGWPGAWIAQHAWRHKSRKASFLVAFWLAVILNVVALTVLVVSGGDLLP